MMNRFLCLAALLGAALFLTPRARAQDWQPVTSGLPANGRVQAIAGNGAVIYLSLSAPAESVGIYASVNGGLSWTKTTGVMPGGTFTDQLLAAGDTVLAGRNASNGILFRSTDSGATWQAVTGLPGTGNIYMLVRDGNTHYAQEALTGPYRSTDDGLTWTLANTGLTGNPLNLGALNGRVFANHINSGLWVSSNQGDTWTQILTAESSPASRMATLGNRVFAAVSTLGLPGVVAVSDGSTTVENAATGLPANFAIADLVSSSSTVFAAGHTNLAPTVWQTLDGGATWAKVAAGGLPGQVATRIWVQGNTLLAGTTDSLAEGTGLHRLTLRNGAFFQAPAIVKPPAPVTAGAGQQAQFTVTAYGQGPFSYQWRSNGLPIPGATLETFTLRNLKAAYAADYAVEVANTAGPSVSPPAALTIIPTTPGSLDLSFNSAPVGADFGGLVVGGFVQALAVQSDGKILAAGNFNRVNAALAGANASGGTACGNVARFLSDGAIDGDFLLADGANNVVKTLALQADGKILIGGQFTSYQQIARGRLARLNTNGSLDTSFMNGLGGFDGDVNAIAVQGDGKILIGGAFLNVHGSTRPTLVRLTSTGAADGTFFGGQMEVGGTVNAITLSGADIYIGGNFTAVNSTARARIAKLNSFGQLDTAFDTSAGFNAAVNSLAVQADGKVVAGGNFTTFKSVMANRIARINSAGALDNAFGSGLNQAATAVAIQPGGKILAGGAFLTANGVAKVRLARFTSAGALDAAFDVNTGPNQQISALALQADGQVLVGGVFSQITQGASVYPRFLLARVFATTPSPTLDFSATVSNLHLDWTGNFILQQNDEAKSAGWTDVPGTPPMTLPLEAAPRRVFRLKEIQP